MGILDETTLPVLMNTERVVRVFHKINQTNYNHPFSSRPFPQFQVILKSTKHTRRLNNLLSFVFHENKKDGESYVENRIFTSYYYNEFLTFARGGRVKKRERIKKRQTSVCKNYYGLTQFKHNYYPLREAASTKSQYGCRACVHTSVI